LVKLEIRPLSYFGTNQKYLSIAEKQSICGGSETNVKFPNINFATIYRVA